MSVASPSEEGQTGQEPMATVRESIAALYEQSRKSAGQGQAMLAVIESEAVSPDEVDFDIPGADARPSIARRFDDLRDLAEREAREDTSTDDAPTPTDGMVGAPDDFSAGSFGATPNAVVGFEDAVPNIAPQAAADDAADTPATPDLPSEPPAPATGDALSDLGVADIQELVRQAWEDETALGQIAVPHDDNPPGDEDNSDAEDDPDIAAAMEEIAAAVVQSGDAAIAVDLDGMKADIVAAMRAELQAVVATDLRPMIRAAIAEALQELPAAKPAPHAKKAATKKSAAKKASTKKSAATTARKTAPAGTSKAATITESDANTSDAAKSDAAKSDAAKSDDGDSET